MFSLRKQKEVKLLLWQTYQINLIIEKYYELGGEMPMNNKKKLETAYFDIAIPQNAENLQLQDRSL